MVGCFQISFCRVLRKDGEILVLIYRPLLFFFFFVKELNLFLVIFVLFRYLIFVVLLNYLLCFFEGILIKLFIIFFFSQLFKNIKK